MPEIKLKTRIQNKYKILEEWDQLVKGDFIPLKGEVCYGIDENTLYEKVGDGETDFVDLPWLLNQSDWLENDKTSPSYVQNRIAYTEVAEGDPILEIKYVNNDGISNPIAVLNNTGIVCEGREFAEEDIGKLWSFNLKCTNTDGTSPLEIDIPGPVELKTFESDGDIICYYGNFYRFYVMYAIMELQDEIAAGDITVEDIEQIVRDELQIEDTNENYAFVNMYGTIIGAIFGATPDDPNNFNYEFSLSSYPTIVHKLDSKYLEEVNLVGKFQDIEDYNEIFNDYANNRAQGTYAHIEGKNNRMGDFPIAVHIEGSNNIAKSDYAHVEGYYNTVGHNGQGSHAEGCNTTANGSSAHAEGNYSAAITNSWQGASHAEGKGSYASGTGAHAEGGSPLLQKPDVNGNIKVGSWTTIDVLSDGCIYLPSSARDINTRQFYIRSDEISAYINHNGYLTYGTLSEEIIQSGYLHNVTCEVNVTDLGAIGDYSHTEGYNNIALGNHSHAEGSNNYVSGENGHVGGYNNVANGENSFVHGQNLKSTSANQFVVGTYNEPDADAALMVGRGSSAFPKNILTVKNNGDLKVSGRITDGENLNTDIWKTIYQKPCTAAKTLYYNFIDYYDLPFEPSELIQPGKVKVQLTSGNKYPDSWIIYNGNILPKNWIESKTLEDGTTITLNDDDTITVNKVAGQELKLPIYSYKADSGAYCWDETANEDMYFIFDVPRSSTGHISAQIISNPGQHLIEFDPAFTSFNNVLSLYAAAEVSGTYIIHRPTLTNMRAPVRYVPYMEPIIINNTKESIDFNEILDITSEPFCGSLVIHSDDYEGYYSIYVDAVPKSIINENRMQFILDDLKEDLSTSLILKSPNGTKFNITVNDDGTLSTTQV